MENKDFETVNENQNETCENIHEEKTKKLDENLMSPYFVKHPKGGVLGGMMEFFGFSLAMFFSVFLIGLIALDVTFQGISLLLVPMAVIAALIILLLFIGIKGRVIRSRSKRFKNYKRILNGREFCDIEELADVLEMEPEVVVKDLKEMIECQWFLQGHLDSQEKYLFVTDVMYEQYTLAMQKFVQ